jgi:hypothetical protein
MQRLKVLGLALAAVFAVSALVATSAMAVLPEIEIISGPQTLKSAKKAESPNDLLETTSGKKVECTNDASTSKLGASPTKELKEVKVTFTGCTSSFGTCTSSGAASGEIKVNELIGTVGYINKTTTPKEVGVSLTPVVSGGLFAEFKCGIATVKVGEKAGSGSGDSVIGKLTPVETATAKVNLVFSQSVGKQIPEKFEGGAKDVLESELGGLGWLQSGQASQDVVEQTTAGSVKIKA